MVGCAMPEAEQGLNVARIASLRAGVPVDASAVTMNRFCASGLQAIASAAEHVMCGFADIVIAGGTESMSLVPMGGNKVCPNPTLVEEYPDVYLSTGLVAENHAREYGISRKEQERFALHSHQRAGAAPASRRSVSGRVLEHRARGVKPCAGIRDFTRGTGPVCAAQPPACCRRHRRGEVCRRDHTSHVRRRGGRVEREGASGGD